MKSFDSRTYSISDFVEWDRNKQLELNPSFQRRAVWSDKAKSYLIDTILRGKPIPKIFIRQKINVTTKTTAKEVVDGQQRLRSILSFIKDGFVVSKRQNPDFGGRRFSQLPVDVQAQILSYEVSVDLLVNLPDSEVLDIFGRLNSYAVILNEQEVLQLFESRSRKKIINIYFANGRPYEPHLSGLDVDLSDIRAMRNASAHISSTTQTVLETVALRILGTPSIGISLYQLLTTIDPRPGAAPSDTVFETCKNKLILTAELISQG